MLTAAAAGVDMAITDLVSSYGAARARGFSAMEVALTGSTWKTSLAALAAHREKGEIALSTLRLSPQLSLGACDRTLLVEEIGYKIDAAATLHVGTVILPLGIGHAPPRTPYLKALSEALDLLLELRHLAEDHGVTLAIDVAEQRFLLSPWEAIELLDRVNSPRIALLLDLQAAGQSGDAADWCATLGRRLAVVRWVPWPDAPAEEPDWSAVGAALREIDFSGPVIIRQNDIHGAAGRLLPRVTAPE